MIIPKTFLRNAPRAQVMCTTIKCHGLRSGYTENIVFNELRGGAISEMPFHGPVDRRVSRIGGLVPYAIVFSLGALYRAIPEVLIPTYPAGF